MDDAYHGQAQDASAINQEIDNLENLYSSRQFKEFWILSRRIMDLFKTVKPLLHEDRERLWSRYSAICADAKQQRERHQEELRTNASTIEHEVEELESTHVAYDSVLEQALVPPFVAVGGGAGFNYRDFWAHAKQISELFKNSRLAKEDRDRLWARFRSICDTARTRQEEGHHQSRQKRESIEDLIRQAGFQADGSHDKEDLEKAKSMQSDALRMMKESRLLRQDREALWSHWKETNDKVFWKRKELQDGNYNEVRSEAGKCLNNAHYANPYEALVEVKHLQTKLRGYYMSKEQRQDIRNTLEDAWNEATSRISHLKEEKRQKHEEWLRRQEERRKKHEEWVDRTESNIARWEGNIEKAEAFISRLEGQIDDLEEKAASAYSDEWADRFRDWIGEKQEKIFEVREQIRELERKIDSAKGRLND